MSEKNKVAVVLGSGLKADGGPSEVTELRALAAAKFVLKRPMKLITSGSLPPYDKSSHGLSEASVMAEIVKASGVETPILIEDESFDTFGNAILSSLRFLKFESPGVLTVVTSPFHAERAVFIFKKVLGHKWRVRSYNAPEWEYETRHLKSEEALVRAREFFSDIVPGDLSACVEKLVTRIPAYEGSLKHDHLIRTA